MDDLIGYARVSTTEQVPALQLDALQAAGAARVFTDHAGGALAERPELTRALDHLRAGDTLMVWKLDRLGRSLRHLIDTVRALEERGVGFRSLQEHIDTTTPAAGSSSTSSPPLRSLSATSSVSARTPGWPRRGRADATAGARRR